MSENVIIQEGGKGARMPNVDHILTEDKDTGELIPWVPESERKSGIKYISKNGTFRASDDKIHSWSKVNVGVIGGKAGTSAPSEDRDGRQVPTGDGKEYIVPAGIGHSVEGYDDYQGGDYTVNVVSGIATDPETGMERRGMPVLRYPIKPPKQAGEPFVPRQIKDKSSAGAYAAVLTGHVTLNNTRTYVASDNFLGGASFTDSSDYFDEHFEDQMSQGVMYSEVLNSEVHDWAIDVEHTTVLLFDSEPIVQYKTGGYGLIAGIDDCNYDTYACMSLYEPWGSYEFSSRGVSPILMMPNYFSAVRINLMKHDITGKRGGMQGASWSSEYNKWIRRWVTPQIVNDDFLKSMIGTTIYKYRGEDDNTVLDRAGIPNNDTLIQNGSRIYCPDAEFYYCEMDIRIGVSSLAEVYGRGRYSDHWDEGVLYSYELEPSYYHNNAQILLRLPYQNMHYFGRYDEIPEDMFDASYGW